MTYNNEILTQLYLRIWDVERLRQVLPSCIHSIQNALESAGDSGEQQELKSRLRTCQKISQYIQNTDKKPPFWKQMIRSGKIGKISFSL